jgi:hypothetical protein
MRVSISHLVFPPVTLEGGAFYAPISPVERVFDGMGRGQPACHEEWKMFRKKRRILMPM